MSVERIPAMMEKIDHLTDSVARLEDLIVREIQELKAEQIADLKRQNERLADDQRRAWEAIRSLELERSSDHGRGRVISGLVTGLISIISSSSVAVLITKFLK